MGTVNAQNNLEVGNDDAYIHGGSIEAFFAESVIFLTGATGFLGKALLEKLLRSCPRLATIFILIRPKQGQTIEQRYKNLIEQPVFDGIRAKSPAAFNKIYPIKGDVSLPNLGITPEDRNMLVERVNIVFHSAATVKFDEPLKVAVNLNTKGTDRVTELCKNMKNLISVIHVSTAYSNANRQDIQEAIYPTKVKPYTVIDMCEGLDDDTLNVLEKKILENHPNTYTFTKNLAEQIVMSKAKDLPIAIVRPSIVCAAEKEPFPGWVDNLCGITGTMKEMAKGTLRTILANSNLKLDAVPVDYVVDTLICASWHSTMQHNNPIKIYNCTSNANALRWSLLGDLVKKHATESPTKSMMWYPGCTFRTNKFTHNFMSYTLHIFPAFIGDFFLRILGNKPVMMKTAKRYERLGHIVEFFTTREWSFHRNNMDDMSKKIKALKDCANFNVDMQHLNWDTYLQDYIRGINKYILNENPETLDNARTRLLILYWVHRLTQLSSIVILLSVILRIGH